MSEQWFVPIQITLVRESGQTTGGTREVHASVPTSYYPGGKRWRRVEIVRPDLELIELLDDPTGDERNELIAVGAVPVAGGRPTERTTIKAASRTVDEVR